jgi:hypothetical protein
MQEVENGGAGSGNFDHAGRPGLVGGSQKYNSGVSSSFGAYSSAENSSFAYNSNIILSYKDEKNYLIRDKGKFDLKTFLKNTGAKNERR